MSDVTPDGPRPKVKGHDSLVDWGTDLALIGVFVRVVQARFRGANEGGLPWYWSDDPRPDADETNQAVVEPVPDGDPPPRPRKLMIESAMQDDPEARNFRPAVFVDIEEARHEKVVVGNLASLDRPTRFQAFYAMTNYVVTVNCVSTQRVEAAIIGNIVWHHLMSTQQIVRDTFHIHALGNFTKTKPQPYRRHPDSPDSWATTITTVATIEERWFTRPNAPMIQEIAAEFALGGDGSGLLGAARSVLYSKRRR